jgi:hypothetical protein
MCELKYITPDTDLTNIKPIDWDVVVGNHKYQVYQVPGYIHSISSRSGNNEYWCCPYMETPTVDNLIPFDGEPVTWGVVYKQTNYIRSKWDTETVERGGCGYVTRNGEIFYELRGRDRSRVFAQAELTIVDLSEHTINFHSRKWKEEMIGRLISYCGIYDKKPKRYRITSIIEDQGCFFAAPVDDNNQIVGDGHSGGIKCEYLDPHVNWHPTDPRKEW